MSTFDHDTDAQMRRRVADLERTVATLKSQHTESLRLLHDEIGRLQQACALDQLSELIPTDPQSHSQAEMATQTETHESSFPFLASLTEQLINAEAASTLALSAFASQSSQTTAQFAALFQTLSSQVKERDSVIVQLQETMTERDSQLEAMRALVSKQAVELDAVKKRLATSEAVSTQVKKQLASFVSADVLVRESPRRTITRTRTRLHPRAIQIAHHLPRFQSQFHWHFLSAHPCLRPQTQRARTIAKSPLLHVVHDRS
ncbi:hypothetical protein BCR44DRAFT_1216725 [Catenaria anguillulae PL171]|uniref:CCDC92/74 N-terminal domain-containing protein n=1 Tax=Catenaria anguillulae PL171 TaxID=765915 RepID=A0A1Y2HZ21_9FUNG|nr:hypothetical protein BCR44DRAFT_1216725 [Catenaria anguillulae PL171]